MFEPHHSPHILKNPYQVDKGFFISLCFSCQYMISLDDNTALYYQYRGFNFQLSGNCLMMT